MNYEYDHFDLIKNDLFMYAYILYQHTLAKIRHSYNRYGRRSTLGDPIKGVGIHKRDARLQQRRLHYPHRSLRLFANPMKSEAQLFRKPSLMSGAN